MSLNNVNLLNVIKSASRPCVIAGDFNYSDIDWSGLTPSNRAAAFFDTITEQFLSQHIDFPTHISGNQPDLILASNPNLISNVENIGHIGESDHNLILCHINVDPYIYIYIYI